MNMKLQLDPVKLAKQAGMLLYRFRTFLIIIIVLGLVGYAGYLASQIVNLQPNQAYLSAQQQKDDDTKINFDKATVQTINNLSQVNPTVNLTNIGKSDPFSPTP